MDFSVRQLRLVDAPMASFPDVTERRGGRARDDDAPSYQKKPGRWRDDNRERARERAARTKRERRAWTNHVKEVLGCQLCGWNGEPRLLHFHHQTPAGGKAFKIADLLTQGRARVVAEVGKCILVCANCHTAIHRGEIPVDHIPTIDLDDFPPMPA